MNTKAKVTQQEANDYMAGWKARHEGKPLPLPADKYGKDYETGWDDCHRGVINFERAMGPDDLAGDGYNNFDIL